MVPRSNWSARTKTSPMCGFRSAESDIEGMEVIGEDGQSLEDEDEETLDEEEEEEGGAETPELSEGGTNATRNLEP